MLVLKNCRVAFRKVGESSSKVMMIFERRMDWFRPRTKVTGETVDPDLQTVNGESSAAKSVAMPESSEYLIEIQVCRVCYMR